MQEKSFRCAVWALLDVCGFNGEGMRLVFLEFNIIFYHGEHGGTEIFIIRLV